MENKTKDTRKDSLDSCINLLSGKRDEERFAGLLLASKILEQHHSSADKDKQHTHSNNEYENTLERIFTAVGSRFLSRLLHTDNSNPLYTQVALHVIAALALSPAVACNPQFTRLIVPVARTLLRCDDSTDHNDNNNNNNNDNTQSYPIPMDAVTDIVDRIASYPSSITLADTSAAVQDISQQLNTQYNYKCINNTPSSSDVDIDPLCSARVRILRDILRAVPESADMSCVTPVADIYYRSNDALKFDAQEVLAAVLSSSNNTGDHNIDDKLNVTNARQWTWKIQQALRRVLGSRLGQEQRQAALLLMHGMFVRYGGDWTLQDNRGDIQEDSTDHCQFVDMIVRLVDVEVRVGLEDVLKYPHESSLSSSSSSSSSSSISLSLGGKLALRCMMDMLMLLSPEYEEDSSWTLLPTETLMQVQRTLLDTIRTVIEFLESMEDKPADHRHHSHHQHAVSRTHEDMLDAVEICAHVLGVWTSHLRIPHLRFAELTTEEQDREELPQIDGRLIHVLPFLASYFHPRVDADGIYVHPVVMLAPYIAFLTARHLDKPAVRSLFTVHSMQDLIAQILMDNNLLMMLCSSSSESTSLFGSVTSLLDILINLVSPTAAAADTEQKQYAQPFLPLLSTFKENTDSLLSFSGQNYQQHEYRPFATFAYLSTVASCLLLHDNQYQYRQSIWPKIVCGFLFQGGQWMLESEMNVTTDNLVELWEVTAHCLATDLIRSDTADQFSWIKHNPAVLSVLHQLTQSHYHNVAVICTELADEISAL